MQRVRRAFALRAATAACSSAPSAAAGSSRRCFWPSASRRSLLVRWVGEDFFPSVDSGQFKLHLRAPDRHAHRGDRRALRPRAGRDPRDHPEGRDRQRHRQHRPAVQRHQPVVHELGADRVVGRGHPRRALRPSSARPIATFTICGCALANEFPGVLFSFIPADIVTQILNFGLPAPIDVQVIGRNLEANRQFASKLADAARAGARHGRPARASGVQPAAAPSRRRPHARRADRLHAARRRQQPADLALRQQPDDADVLAEPGDRRQLFGGDADAAVSRRFAARASATFP